MPQTLLLADDSVTIQRVIELTFADEDIQVVAVSDGDQAIARLNAKPPDIVLVDVGMPGKNGYEVAQYVKQTPQLAHIPVVLLTGAFEPVDEVKAAAAGCDGVLAKPFEPQLVIGRVRELLGRPPLPVAPLDADLTLPAGSADQWPKATARPPLTVAPVSAVATSAGVMSAGAISASATSGGPISVGATKLDDYFDQLDAAFSNLSATPGTAGRAGAAAASAPAEIDWFGLQPAAAPSGAPDLSLAPPASHPAFAAPVASKIPVPSQSAPALVRPPVPVAEAAVIDPAPAPAPALVSAPAPPPAPAVASPPPAAVWAPAPVPAVAAPLAPAPPLHQAPLPPLADAFAALLAAEQGGSGPVASPAWPAGAGAAAPDDLVEQVSLRVLKRLSDRVVRDAVAETVSLIAERLVREEIERIKASIK